MSGDARWSEVNESIDKHIKGNTFHCCCGQKIHLSVMHKTLYAIAREAYRLGKMDAQAAIESAIQVGYIVGKEP